MSNPSFADFVGRSAAIVGDYLWPSTNELFAQYPGVVGVKTGTTDEAGQCLVAYVTGDDDRLARQALLAFDRSRGIDGLTRSRYPSRVRQTIPTFSLWWVAMVHDFALWRGDLAFVADLMPGVRAVLDAYRRNVDDDGAPVAFGDSGWLKIRGIPGVSLFLEYLGNPEATAAAFDAEGWFDTGDLVTPFDDGHIRSDNRGEDMLRVGAENVSAPTRSMSLPRLSKRM